MNSPNRRTVLARLAEQKPELLELFSESESRCHCCFEGCFGGDSVGAVLGICCRRAEVLLADWRVSERPHLATVERADSRMTQPEVFPTTHAGSESGAQELHQRCSKAGHS